VPVVYPFFIAVITILHIVAGNPGQAQFSDALMPMLISLGFTLVAFLVLRLILKNWEAAGLIVGLFLVLFFTYGYIFAYLRGVAKAAVKVPGLIILTIVFAAALTLGVFLIVKYKTRLRTVMRTSSGKTLKVMAIAYLAGLLLIFLFGYVISGITLGALQAHLMFFTFCAVMVVGTYLIVKYKDRLRNPTLFLNVMSGALLVLVLVNVFMSGSHGGPNIKVDEVRQAANNKAVTTPDPATLPDIYYIILDSYGSESFLSSHYGYDNSGFVRWLEDRGFYVARDSQSNYNQTYWSLASSLNLNYVDPQILRKGDNATLRKMIEDNSLMRFLKSKGYRFAFFGSSYPLTQRNRYADFTLGSGWANSEFTRTLLSTTAVRYFTPAHTTRKAVLNAFSNIPRARNEVDGPLFLFAHIEPPHAPYLFDRNGKPLKQTDDEDKMYVEQLMFVNKKVETLVDRILAESKRPPVIIVQGDHSPKQSGKTRQTEILNVYHLPVGANLLYPSITPVNSFRVVLNSVFGTDFKLLQDHSYEGYPEQSSP